MTNAASPETKSNITKLIEQSHPEVKTVNLEARFPATETMFDRLSPDECKQVELNVAVKFGPPAREELVSWKTRSLEHYRREILRLGATVLPSVFKKKIHLVPVTPPHDVHSMIRQEYFVGDLYSCDMTADAVHSAGYQFEAGSSYLEFGCSSAPLLRTMSAAYPDARWFGCDPVPASIEWAKANFPQLNLVCSPQSPPLKYANESFSGAFAISFWSHFSERAGLAWFEEMHRIIAPQGFLMFTTHGYRSLYYYLTQGTRDPQTMSQLVHEVAAKQYAFHPIFQILNIEDSGLELSDWGDCYLTSDWVVSKLGSRWEIVNYEPGRNQSNQDVYVLRRR